MSDSRTIRELALAWKRALGGEFVGLSDGEIHEVCEDQGLECLPQCYIEFLQLMGRKAGQILRGTDAFYPDILGVKNDAHELLTENGVENLIGPNAVVFAMHQGYQVFWMADNHGDDPSVLMYQEGDEGVSGEWKSFTSFLNDEAKRVAL